MSGSGKPTQSFQCLVLALGISITDTAERFADMFSLVPNVTSAATMPVLPSFPQSGDSFNVSYKYAETSE